MTAVDMAHPAAYLLSLPAVREQTSKVWQRARRNELKHFDVDLDRLPDYARFVVDITKRDYGTDYKSIPPHGRLQHFDAGGATRLENLLKELPGSTKERLDCVFDLCMPSVLLDAGAGDAWKYHEGESFYTRSEGIAVASIDMFKAGLFSSDSSNKLQVDATALMQMTEQKLAQGFQVTDRNPIAGLAGRAQLLQRFGEALQNKELYGSAGRPSGLIEHFLESTATGDEYFSVSKLWDALQHTLVQTWPSRHTLDGVPLGDCWPCASAGYSSDLSQMKHTAADWQGMVPFHKLTQWLTYSLVTVLQRFLPKVPVRGLELLTALPEYRNGGGLVDMGVLTLKQNDVDRGVALFKQHNPTDDMPSAEIVPMFLPSDDVIVEWRALTIPLLDQVLPVVREMLGDESLSLQQLLEAGTWKAGRELAKQKRPASGGPPISILSDGTVF